MKKSLAALTADLETIYRSAGELLGKGEKAFMARLDAHRQKLDEHVDAAGEKVSGASEQTTVDSLDSISREAREKLSRQLEKLRQENQKIRAQLKTLGDKGAASWKDLKKVVQDLWKGLQNTYRQYLG